MPIVRKRGSFISEDEATETEAILNEMVSDKAFITEDGYSTNTELYPDKVIPFVDKHMHYLRTHAVNPQHYVSNLRLMTRIR